MSIVPLHKVALVGTLDHKEEALIALQDWGYLHLDDKLSNAKVNNQDIEQTLSRMHKLSEKLKKALRYLDGVKQPRRQLHSQDTRVGSDELLELVDSILANEDLRRRTQDQIDALKEREANLLHWGNFDFPEGESIGGHRLWFYLLPRKHRSALKDLSLPWQIVHQNHNQLWVVVVAVDEPPVDALPCERIHTGKYSLETIRQQRELCEVELDEIEAERQKLTRHIQVLKNCQTQAEDITDLANAQQLAIQEGTLFVLHGWIAETQLKALQKLCVEHSMAMVNRPVKEQDNPPTLLQNTPNFAAGELLVNFYQTPAYRSWDPSIPLFLSFALFFAMILSDAGYALLMLLGVAAYWRKLGKSVTGLQLRPLLMSVLVLSVVWGVMVGSYFGREPDPNSLLGQMNWIDLRDFNFMMALSIGCGLAHLWVANAQQIWIHRGSHLAWFHSGWLILLMGAPIMGLTWQQQSSITQIGMAMSIAGALLIFWNASNRPVNQLSSAVLRVLEGLKALTNITNLFGDVLSYLRLFALGLASSSLALTFNDLSDRAFAAEGGFGVISGLVIFLIGHVLNIFLGIVSGVVHGLRLNFIEFYKWALYGEGYPFRAFKKRESTK